MEKLGDPQNDLAVIHVAGTNGKGSVCRLLEAAWRVRLQRGLYISPFLRSFNERIALGRRGYHG